MRKKMSKITMFLLAILAATSASAINVTLTKTEQGWTVYNSTYIQSLASDGQGVYGAISSTYINPLKSGSCRVTTLNHTMSDSDMKARVSCQGQSFTVTFSQYGNTVSPSDVEQGSQVTIVMSDDISGGSSNQGSSVPAKKAQPEYPNHYRGRADPSHEH